MVHNVGLTNKHTQTHTHWDWQHCIVHHQKLITNMQNHRVHHPIGTKLHFTLPKCTLVRNYIMNLDLHVRCQTQKYYTMPLCTTCICSQWNFGVGVNERINFERSRKELWKMSGGAPWYTTQPSGEQHRLLVHHVVLYPQGGAQHSFHKPRWDHFYNLDCWRRR